jgi:hypothetical protein
MRKWGALWLTIVVMFVIGVIVNLREDGSLWRLVPVTVVALLFVGGFMLIRWRVWGVTDLSEPELSELEDWDQPDLPPEPLAIPSVAVEPEPAVLGQAATTSVLPPANPAAGTQAMISGALGGLLAFLAADAVFVYLNYEYSDSLVQAQFSEAGRVLLCLPISLLGGTAVGFFVGDFVRREAMNWGMRGKKLARVTIAGTLIGSFVAQLLVDGFLWMMSYM